MSFDSIRNAVLVVRAIVVSLSKFVNRIWLEFHEGLTSRVFFRISACADKTYSAIRRGMIQRRGQPIGLQAAVDRMISESQKRLRDEVIVSAENRH